MKGMLKKGPFRKGLDYPASIPDAGRSVQIVSVENHPIYGKRYKILGYDGWFEANCFDVIIDDSL